MLFKRSITSLLFISVSSVVASEPNCRDTLRELYPLLSATHTHSVSIGSRYLHVEESGNPKGIPIVIIHGKFSGELQPIHRRLFDPLVYRIIQYDQMGCGLSSLNPCFISLDEQVSHLEAIRRHLNISRMHIFASSFGTSIALNYAVQFPHRVTGMILKSIFLARTKDWEFNYRKEILDRFPNSAEVLTRDVKPREAILDSLYSQLTSGLRTTQERAAISMSTWRSTLLRRRDLNSPLQNLITDDEILKLRLYSVHEFRFARREKVNLLPSLHRLQEIPIFLVHGTDDLISPISGARETDLFLPDGCLLPVSAAGHSILEPSIYSRIINSTELLRCSAP